MSNACRMRITHVVENLNRGGLERVVIDLVEQQQTLGHACQIVCLFEPGQLAPEIERLGVPLVSCHKRYGLDFAAVRRMRAAVRHHHPDVLHTHNAMAHYYAVLATAFLPLRRINTRHGMANYPFSRKRELFYRLAMAFSDMAAVVCDKARENFLRYRIIPAAKAITVYNGIPVGRFQPRSPEARKQLLAETGWADNSVLLGIVARLNPPKDHKMLLRAMALVRQGAPPARLVVVGNGPLRAELESLSLELGLQDAVRFLGDRSDVQALLPGLDIFVLSSVTEGYSISLLEACAAALPIVATDVGGNREIVRDGTNGFLVPARSPEEFSDAVLRLVRDSGLRAEMGRRNRQFAEEGGSVQTMAERYNVLYGCDTGNGLRPSLQTARPA